MVALTLALTAFAVDPSAASPKKGTALAKTHTLAQAGHATFWDCPSKTTELLVVVNTLTLHPGATLDVSFTVRNGGTTSCNYTAPYASVAPGPTSTSLTAGPCGSVGYEIENSHHHNVWPGAQVVNCRHSASRSWRPAPPCRAPDRGTRPSRTARTGCRRGTTPSRSRTSASASPYTSTSPDFRRSAASRRTPRGGLP